MLSPCYLSGNSPHGSMLEPRGTDQWNQTWREHLHNRNWPMLQRFSVVFVKHTTIRKAQMVKNFPKVSEPVRRRAGIWTQAFWPESVSLIIKLSHFSRGFNECKPWQGLQGRKHSFWNHVHREAWPKVGLLLVFYRWSLGIGLGISGTMKLLLCRASSYIRHYQCFPEGLAQ